jgi:hypothetical protein
MRNKRLVEVLLHASLVAVPAGGCCSDDEHSGIKLATRAEFGDAVDACIADEQRCRPLCEAFVPEQPRSWEGECKLVEVHPDGVLLAFDWIEQCPRAGRRPRGFVSPAPR